MMKKIKETWNASALLGVGQGSIRGSYLVTIEWKGLKNNSKPLSICWKGCLF